MAELIPKRQIPQRLWQAGLAPKNVTILEKNNPDLPPHDRGPYFYYGEVRWRPANNFDHIKHLIDRFKISIEWLEDENLWIIYPVHAGACLMEESIENIPYKVCLVVLAEYGLRKEEDEESTVDSSSPA